MSKERVVYTGLLLAAGVASSISVGSLLPVAWAVVAVVLGFSLVRSKPAELPDARPVTGHQLDGLSGELRRRFFALEQTRDQVKALLSQSGREADLWKPELERVDKLLVAFVMLAERVDADDAFASEDAQLERRVRELEADGESPELASAQERLASARARQASLIQRQARLTEIEDTLATVRDRISAIDAEDLHPEMEALLGGVEAATAAELETSRLLDAQALQARRAQSGRA